jgi:hypothetical protein
MADTQSIPPALTPSQWKAFSMWLEYGSPPVKSPAFPIFQQAFVDRATMHALAAMCLKAPPDIGFTQEDVDVVFGYAHAEAARGNRDFSDRIAALAARIAALLPPPAHVHPS